MISNRFELYRMNNYKSKNITLVKSLSIHLIFQCQNQIQLKFNFDSGLLIKK